MSKLQIQVYGQFAKEDNFSHAVVSRGLVRGLLENGLDCICASVGPPGDMELPVGATPGLEATPIGLYVGGYPPFIPPFLSTHQYKVALLIAESEVLPPSWAPLVDDLDLACFPSRWVKKAYVRAGVDDEKTLVVPHGVNNAFYQDEMASDSPPPKNQRCRIQWRFLHMNGAPGHPERKGTPQLIKAFGRVFGTGKYGNALLEIRQPLNFPIPVQQLFSLAKKWSAKYAMINFKEPAWSMGPCEMVAFLRSQDLFADVPSRSFRLFPTGRHDEIENENSKERVIEFGLSALIQPSRAEGFGLIPCEARAVGLPVVVTHCAGHADHAELSDVVVEHGPSAPITVSGCPDDSGQAPTVTVEAIMAALVKMVENEKAIRVAAWKTAKGYQERHSWENVTRELAERLRAIVEK